MALPRLGEKFKQPGASPSAPATPDPTRQAAPAQSSSRSRFKVKTSTTDYSKSDAAGLVAPEQVPLKGIYPCYVSKVGTTKIEEDGSGGALTFSLTVMAEGRKENGQERTFYCAPNAKKNDYGKKKDIEDIAKFFAKSGLPESMWPPARSGKGKVPPVLDLFTVAVDFTHTNGAEVEVRVPLVVNVEFDMEVNEKDPTKAYPKIRSAIKDEKFIVAKLPSYTPPWVAETCGWPYKEGKYSDVIVLAQDAASAFPGLLDGEMLGRSLVD